MNPRSPLRSIWLHPAETVNYVAHENPGYRLFVLPVAAGFVTLPTVALFGDHDSELSIGFVLGSLIAFGPVTELLQVFVGAYLIRLTGAWLGGKASSSSIQTVLVWCNVPIVTMGLIGIAVYLVAAALSASGYGPLQWGQSPTVVAIGWGLLCLQLILIGWSIAISLRGIGAVQGFSTARATVNALLAWSIPAVLLIAVTVILGLSGNLQWLFFGDVDELLRIHAPR